MFKYILPLAIFFYCQAIHAQQYYGTNDLRPVYQQNTGAGDYIITLPEGIEICQTGTNTQYLVCDHLFSTRVVVTPANSTVASTDYDPYGQMITNNLKIYEDKFRYAGTYMPDTASRLYSSPTRKYSPVTYRYQSTDPFRQSPSPYTYAGNNPVNNADQTGNTYVNSICWRYSPLGWLYGWYGYRGGTVTTIHNNRVYALDIFNIDQYKHNNDLMWAWETGRNILWDEAVTRVFVTEIDLKGLKDNLFYDIKYTSEQDIKKRFAFGSGKNRYFDMDRYYKQLFVVLEQERRRRPERKSGSREEKISVASLIHELPEGWQIIQDQSHRIRRQSSRSSTATDEEAQPFEAPAPITQETGLDYTRYRFQAMKARNLSRQLNNNVGFTLVRQKGSHKTYRFNPTGKSYTISERGNNEQYDGNLLRNMAEGFGLDEETIGLFGGELIR